ncbi:hypothetical protein BKI52_23795 [marine bacterium AO1-C]|nr:hypothetical protein BKI52_23795 [marine bacterium AO1-C]
MNAISDIPKIKNLLFSPEEKNVLLGISLAKNQGVFAELAPELHEIVQQFLFSGNEEQVYQALHLSRALDTYHQFARLIHPAIQNLCGWSVNFDQLTQEEKDDYWVEFLTEKQLYASRMYSNPAHSHIPEQTSFPRILKRLTFLEEIDLSCHKITHLPAWIGVFQQLKILNLYANRIEVLPMALTRLQQLEALYLHGNCLQEIPHFLTQLPHLKTLDISDNGIWSIPAWIPEMESLEALVLFTCWGSSPDLAIPKEIGQMKNLKLLNVMTHTVDLPHSIGELSTLEALKVGGGKYPNAIPESITQLKNLTHLQLDGASPEFILDIAGEFPQLQTLSFKNIEDYYPTDQQLEQIKSKVPEDCNVIHAYSY